MKKPGCLGYLRDYTTQLYRGYFFNHYFRIPINQPVFHGMSRVGLFHAAQVSLIQGSIKRVQ